jgi:hypothetical protein
MLQLYVPSYKFESWLEIAFNSKPAEKTRGSGLEFP